MADATFSCRIVLHAERDPAVRQFVRHVLTALGYTVLAAATVAEADRAAAAAPVELLLCGGRLPDGDGALAARLVADRRPGVPVVLVSGGPGAVALPPGSRVLPKPFSPAQLAATVREALTPTTTPSRPGCQGVQRHRPESVASRPAS